MNAVSRLKTYEWFMICYEFEYPYNAYEETNEKVLRAYNVSWRINQTGIDIIVTCNT